MRRPFAVAAVVATTVAIPFVLLGSGSGASLVGPWIDLGNGKAGSFGVPQLCAVASLNPASDSVLDLGNAPPGSFAVLFAAIGNTTPTNLLGGSLQAFPVLTAVTLPVDASGNIQLAFTFPPGVPANTIITVQYIVADPGATFGASFSNALTGTSQ